MKGMMILVLALLTITVSAQVDQRLANGKWAYYGEEFYSNIAAGKKIDRILFDRILNDAHQTVRGKFDVISAPCSGPSAACYRHTSVGYDNARKIMFGELDILRDAQGTYVLDVYCAKKFYFRSLDEVSNMHSQVNIEHTWPQSRFNGSIPKDRQKSDMHHLYLTDSKANSLRGNNPFGMIGPRDDRTIGEGCGKSTTGVAIDGNTVYTPPILHRGNVARALFYFSMHYNLVISASEETILRHWHKSDPVDMKELIRHEAIAKYQKTRNPFVDHPELVDWVVDF